MGPGVVRKNCFMLFCGADCRIHGFIRFFSHSRSQYQPLTVFSIKTMNLHSTAPSRDLITE